MKGYLLLVFIILPFVLSILLIRLQLNDYINKKINNMKSIILFVLTFVSVNMYAQIPDTIYYQPFTFTNSETLGVSEAFVDSNSK